MYNSCGYGRIEARRRLSKVRDLLAWKPEAADVAILELSWKLQRRWQLPFWDPLMVSAAKATDSGYLWTEDPRAGQDCTESRS